MPILSLSITWIFCFTHFFSYYIVVIFFFKWIPSCLVCGSVHHQSTAFEVSRWATLSQVQLLRGFSRTSLVRFPRDNAPAAGRSPGIARLSRHHRNLHRGWGSPGVTETSWAWKLRSWRTPWFFPDDWGLSSVAETHTNELGGIHLGGYRMNGTHIIVCHYSKSILGWDCPLNKTSGRGLVDVRGLPIENTTPCWYYPLVI